MEDFKAEYHGPVKPKRKSVKLVIVTVLKMVTVEPLLFFFIVGYTMRMVTFQNMIMDKFCLVEFEYPKEICSNISSNKMAEDRVQAAAAEFQVYRSLIESVPGFLMCLFVGAWADKYGRKIPMMVASIGLLIDQLAIIPLVVHFDTSVYWLMLASLPSGLTGGMLISLGQTFSFLTEITTNEDRTLRCSILAFTLYIASPLGTELGGVLFKKFEYFGVFTAVGVSIMLGVLWLGFMVKERRPDVAGIGWRKKVRDLFSLENPKQCWKVCTIKRGKWGRLMLWLAFISMAVDMMSMMGSMNVTFPFAKKVLHWDVAHFSEVHAIAHIVTSVGMLVFVAFASKVLKLGDPMLAIIGCLSTTAKYLFLSFTEVDPTFYIAYVAGILSSVTISAVRSFVSKLVGQDDMGKVFSMLAFIEGLGPLIGNSLFTKIWASSVGTFPGLVFLVAAIIVGIPIAMFTFIYLITRNSNEYVKFKDEIIEVNSTSLNSDFVENK